VRTQTTRTSPGASTDGAKRRHIRTSRVAVAAVAAVGCLVVAGCGSSSDSSSSASGSSGGGGKSGSPIKVMALGQFEASTFAYPQGPPAMQAAIKKINDAGGVNGHKLDLTICNDQASPTIAAQCARKAVSDKYAAVIGSYSVQSTSFLPILEAAGIPYMGQDATNSLEGNSKVSFPLESQYQLYASMGYAAGFDGKCKAAGLITEDYGASTDIEDQYAANGFAAASGGGKVVKRVDTGQGAPDYAPAVASMLSAGAKCIISPMPPTELAKVMASVHQSSAPKTPVAVTAASLPASVQKALGSASNGMMVGSAAYSTGATDNPDINDVITQIHALNPKADINSFSIEGYAAVQILAHAMESIKGDIDASSTLAAMQKIDGFETKIEPPYTTTKPGPLKGLPRIYGMGVVVYKIVDGKQKLVSDGFVDLGSKLQ
jgi:ABC-type branched-subunit amino acid transport system substrate-binding protein